MSEVAFEVSRTRDDIVKGIAGNALRSPRSMAWYVGGAAVVATIAVIVSQGDGIAAMLAAGIVAFSGMLLFYSLLFWLTVWMAVRKTERMPGAFEPIKFTLSDAGLRVAATVGEGISLWKLWPFAFETKSVIVVRHELNLIQIIPKRDLASGDVARIRDVLRRNVKKVRLLEEQA